MTCREKYKIGLEASSALTDKLTGIQRYIREVVAAMAELTALEPNLDMEACYKVSRIRKNHYRPELPLEHRWHWPIPGLSTGRYDLLHTLDTTFPKFLPHRLVCTIHDLFSLVLDEYSTPHFRRKKINAYRRIVQFGNAIIVPSIATKKDLIDHLACPEDRIFVVPHGVNECFFRTSSGGCDNTKGIPTGPYVLCFGYQKRKNFSRVLRAFRESGLFKTHMLLVIGSLAPEERMGLRNTGLEKRVRNMDRLTDDKLSILYRKASFLCFPSLYEGFGLPILEAMASGIPVVTSRTSAAADIGKNFAILVSPESVEEIARGMKQALKVDALTLERAKKYAQGFTWHETAKSTLSIYKAILNNGSFRMSVRHCYD